MAIDIVPVQGVPEYFSFQHETHFCRVCQLTLTPKVEIADNRYWVSHYCADHPQADQLGAQEPRPVEGD